MKGVEPFLQIFPILCYRYTTYQNYLHWLQPLCSLCDCTLYLSLQALMLCFGGCRGIRTRINLIKSQEQ